MEVQAENTPTSTIQPWRQSLLQGSSQALEHPPPTYPWLRVPHHLPVQPQDPALLLGLPLDHPPTQAINFTFAFVCLLLCSYVKRLECEKSAIWIYYYYYSEGENLRVVRVGTRIETALKQVSKSKGTYLAAGSGITLWHYECQHADGILRTRRVGLLLSAFSFFIFRSIT